MQEGLFEGWKLNSPRQSLPSFVCIHCGRRLGIQSPDFFDCFLTWINFPYQRRHHLAIIREERRHVLLLIRQASNRFRRYCSLFHRRTLQQGRLAGNFP
jgi:hypothetical protein